MTQLLADYQIVYRAMGTRHEEDRGYLADKYHVPTTTLGDLNRLGIELFGQLSLDERATDLYMAERGLDDAELADQPEFP